MPAETIPSSPAPSDEDPGGVFVVIPAFQEEGAIEEVVRTVRAHYPNVVVVDDGSQDATASAARRAGAHVLRHVINRGQGASLQTALDYALARGAQWIVTFDADGQHDIADVQRLLAALRDGAADFALGSRFLGKTISLPFTRRLTLRFAVWFTRVVSRARLTDAHNGLRAMTRRGAKHIGITLDRMAHASELIDQIVASELTYVEVPVTIRYSEYSLAKGQSSRNALRIVFHYLVGRVMR